MPAGGPWESGVASSLRLAGKGRAALPYTTWRHRGLRPGRVSARGDPRREVSLADLEQHLAFLFGND
jgi:hypothetical protein